MRASDDSVMDEAFDPESRRLCPDDLCVGLIGPDGRCKVCGAASPEGPPPVSTAAPSEPEERPAAEPPAPPPAEEADAFDPDSRVLCSDDTCTGLIGPDGRCKECGRPRQP